MTVYNDEQFNSLCQQASVEQDPNKLLHLVNEISAMLDDKASATHWAEKVSEVFRQ
jgi:hypothetical protein